MAKIGWGRILAGVATAAAAGAAYAYYRKRSAKMPLYQLLLSDGPFEIRRYPPLLMIETVQHGSRDRALGNGFGLLADYMFGEGRDGAEIPIAMPVLSQPLAEGAWRVRFLIPQDRSRDQLDPLGRGIAIVELPDRDVAVVAVPGKPSDRLFLAKERELRRWSEERGRVAVGDAEHAYYNSPLKPGTTLPNEIWLPLSC